MRLQLRSQRHRWSLLFAQCGVFLLCVAAMTGCAAIGTQSGATTQSAPTITTTPPPITNDAPIHQPKFAGGFAAIKPHLAGTPSFFADDMKQYVSAHAIVGPDIVGPDRGSGQPVVVLANFLSCAEIDQQVGGGVARTLNGCGEGAQFGLVIESGGFAFAGSSGGAHLTAPKAFMLFDPTSGNLLMYGSVTGHSQSSTPTPQPGQPTPTTPSGKPTPTTAPHIALTMKPLSAEQELRLFLYHEACSHYPDARCHREQCRRLVERHHRRQNRCVEYGLGDRLAEQWNHPRWAYHADYRHPGE